MSAQSRQYFLHFPKMEFLWLALFSLTVVCAQQQNPTGEAFDQLDDRSNSIDYNAREWQIPSARDPRQRNFASSGKNGAESQAGAPSISEESRPGSSTPNPKDSTIRPGKPQHQVQSDGSWQNDYVFEKGNANEFIDHAVLQWRDGIKKKGFDPLRINAFNQGALSCRGCEIRGLSSIARTGDVTLMNNESVVAIEAGMGLDELHARCHCETSRWLIFNPSGVVDVNLKHYAMFGRVEQHNSPHASPVLTKFSIVNDGDLTTHFDGHGVVGTLLQWFGQSFIKKRIREVLSDEGRMKNLLQLALRQMNLFREMSEAIQL